MESKVGTIVIVVVVFTVLTLTISKQTNIRYAQNKHSVVKSRITAESKGYLCQSAPSSFNSNLN